MDEGRRPDNRLSSGVHSARYGSRLDPDVVFVLERQQRAGTLSWWERFWNDVCLIWGLR